MPLLIRLTSKDYPELFINPRMVAAIRENESGQVEILLGCDWVAVEHSFENVMRVILGEHE